MDDKHIVELYWERNEAAISETAVKYGNYLNSIFHNILSNAEDASECVNDTYHSAWNSMPPHRPALLSAFLGKITRRISIDRLRRSHSKKRGGGELPLVLEELEECIASNNSVEKEIEQKEVTQILNRFLESLPDMERRIFLRCYWYLDSIEIIARRCGFSKSKVTSMLYRTRIKLKEQLGKEGYL